MELYENDPQSRETSQASAKYAESKKNRSCHRYGKPRCTPKTNRHSVQDDLSNAVDYLYRNYTKCRSCNSSSDLVKVTDEQGKILMVWCQFCSHTFGVDDTMSPEVLLNLYKQGHLEVNVGCCANKDPNKFKIEGFDGSNFQVRCLECKTRGILGDQESTGGCKDPGPDELVCVCGNRDQADMTVCMFGDEVRCVICKLCDAYVNLPRVTKTPSEFPENSDIPHPSELVSCECPPGEKNITITEDENGEPEMIACSKCGLCYLPKDPERSSPSKKHREQSKKAGPKPRLPKSHGDYSSKQYETPQYSDVQHISDLHRGDHIMWDRRLGYGHHAIVEHVDPKKGKIRVWHYNGPSPNVTDKVKGEIMQEELDPFEKKYERVYLVKHPNPLPPDEVIQRAKSREGEVHYSLVSNNCEHFATWCKTGKHVSAQVMSVKDCFMKYANACAKVPMLDKIAKGLGRHGVVALMVPLEIGSCVYDICNAADARKKGHLSRDAFVDLTVSRVCQSYCGLAGMALGMAIPIPVVGGFIGGTVGGMIGQFVGKLMGGLVVKGGREHGAW